MQDNLRTKAKELLQGGEVKTVIGYEAGSAPFKCTPLFAATSEDAERLMWNPTCVNNLAVYLPQAVKSGKVAIAVKPCDVKSVVELIKENKVKRDEVVTLVLPCPGVMNLDGLGETDLRDITSVEWQGNDIVVKTASGDVKLPREQVFAKKCLSCDISEPSLVDVKLGDQPTRSPLNGMAAIENYEKMSSEERRDFWAQQFSKCIRCYGCRAACPACYCPECFTDKFAQVWISKSTDPTTNWFFHTTRAMHLAGRCIGCGECVRACPMGIPLNLLGKKIEMDVAEMFGSSPGENTEALPIFGNYDLKDPDPCPE